MNLAKIRRALSLMQEFGRRVDTALADDPDGHFIGGTAATGALRRTSMELTRALAELRRPGCREAVFGYVCRQRNRETGA